MEKLMTNNEEDLLRYEKQVAEQQRLIAKSKLFCVIEGVQLTMDEFQAGHEHVELGYN